MALSKDKFLQSIGPNQNHNGPNSCPTAIYGGGIVLMLKSSKSNSKIWR